MTKELTLPGCSRRAFVGALASPALGLATPWSEFLANGTGSLQPTASLPLEWSESRNVAWRAAIPGYGQSSAVAAPGSAYVTAVEGPNKEVVLLDCVDLETGRSNWTCRRDSSHRIEESDMVSTAAPTPVAGEDAVFAFFETGDLLAIDHKGNVLWERRLTEEFGPFGGRHGIGSSLRLCTAGVLTLVAHDGPSYLLCIDRESGRTLWKADRPKGVSWSTPVVLSHAGREIAVVSVGDGVEAYDTADGAALWQMEGFDGAFVASPVGSPGGAVIGSSAKGRTAAIRFGEDAAETPTVHWRAEEASCYFSSPLVHRGKVYVVSKAGIAFCLDADTGVELWHSRLESQCWATAVGLRDRVYFFGVDGVTTVAQAGDEFVALAKNTVAAEGRLYGATVVDNGLLLRFGRELVRVTGA